MLKIRLQRVGRKHQPNFRVLLTDSKNSAKSGKFLEILGIYDPIRKDATTLKTERIKYWISVGAQPSGTINNLLISKKLTSGKKVHVGKHFKQAEKQPEIKESTEAPAVTA